MRFTTRLALAVTEFAGDRKDLGCKVETIMDGGHIETVIYNLDGKRDILILMDFDYDTIECHRFNQENFIIDFSTDVTQEIIEE